MCLNSRFGILAVAAVGRTARRLHVADAIWLRTQHAEKGLRRHGSGANFDVIRLLQNAAMFGPEALQSQDQFLKGQRILRGRQRGRP